MGRNHQGREAVSENPEIRITYPDWVGDSVDWDRAYETAEDRVRLAIELSRENVERGTGGPFGAAVFERDSGMLVSVGMNLVVAHRNSTLHAEMVALMMAESRLLSYSLGAEGLPPHEVAASCDPCAMCLGGLLWSGVSRVLCGARREDAHILEFDEGPVFPESYRYLENRGIEIQRGVLREEARAVLQLYRERGGVIYNG
jgi:tRNA(Arg) A34 adenosine deaminase TadA